MEQCECKKIKDFKEIEETPFLLLAKREMVYPQKYYMLCQKCYHIIPFILEDEIYKNISEKEGEECD